MRDGDFKGDIFGSGTLVVGEGAGLPVAQRRSELGPLLGERDRQPCARDARRPSRVGLGLGRVLDALGVEEAAMA